MADLFAALIKMSIEAATGSNVINLEIGLGGEGLDHGPMKPRYDMDMAGIHFGYGGMLILHIKVVVSDMM